MDPDGSRWIPMDPDGWYVMIRDDTRRYTMIIPCELGIWLTYPPNPAYSLQEQQAVTSCYCLRCWLATSLLSMPCMHIYLSLNIYIYIYIYRKNGAEFAPLANASHHQPARCPKEYCPGEWHTLPKTIKTTRQHLWNQCQVNQSFAFANALGSSNAFNLLTFYVHSARVGNHIPVPWRSSILLLRIIYI